MIASSDNLKLVLGPQIDLRLFFGTVLSRFRGCFQLKIAAGGTILVCNSGFYRLRLSQQTILVCKWPFYELRSSGGGVKLVFLQINIYICKNCIYEYDGCKKTETDRLGNTCV